MPLLKAAGILLSKQGIIPVNAKYFARQLISCISVENDSNNSWNWNYNNSDWNNNNKNNNNSVVAVRV